MEDNGYAGSLVLPRLPQGMTKVQSFLLSAAGSGKNTVPIWVMTYFGTLGAQEGVPDEGGIECLQQQRVSCVLGGLKFENQCLHDVNILTTFLGTGASLQFRNGQVMTRAWWRQYVSTCLESIVFCPQRCAAERGVWGLVFSASLELQVLVYTACARFNSAYPVLTFVCQIQ